MDGLTLKELEAAIGVLPHERDQYQLVLLDVTLRTRATNNANKDSDGLLEGDHMSSYNQYAQGYFHLIDDIVELVELSSFLTVEALASKIADTAFSSWRSRGTT